MEKRAHSQKNLCEWEFYAGSVFLEPDGMFPNHIPNPEEPEAMEAGAKAVLDSKSDLCIVLDTVSPLSSHNNGCQKIQEDFAVSELLRVLKIKIILHG